MDLVEGCNPYPTLSLPISLWETKSISINLQNRFQKIKNSTLFLQMRPCFPCKHGDPIWFVHEKFKVLAIYSVQSPGLLWKVVLLSLKRQESWRHFRCIGLMITPLRFSCHYPIKRELYHHVITFLAIQGILSQLSPLFIAKINSNFIISASQLSKLQIALTANLAFDIKVQCIVYVFVSCATVSERWNCRGYFLIRDTAFGGDVWWRCLFHHLCRRRGAVVEEMYI